MCALHLRIYILLKDLKASCACRHTPYSINYTYRLVIQSFQDGKHGFVFAHFIQSLGSISAFVEM